MAHALSSPINSTTVRLYFKSLATRLGMGVAATVAPAWTVRKVAQWFITPPRIGHTSPELAALTQGTRVAVASPMGKLAAWRFGDRRAPAVILSHGWGGRGAQFREFVPALVAAGYQAWIFDHASHGLSDGREAPITDFARGVVAVVRHIEREGVPVAGFIGHSLGCAGIGIALKNELAHLTHVRVVQIAPPASLIRYSRFFAKALGLSERLRAAMQWRLEQKIGVGWQEFEMPHAAASLTARALVIHDVDDRDVRVESGLAVARAWPGARFKRTAGLGHRRVLRSREVIGATIDFLADRVVFAPPPAESDWQPGGRAAGISAIY